MKSHLVRQERCPRCAEKGKDRSGDNLSIFSDGHQFCFGCGYYKSGNGITRFKQQLEEDNGKHSVLLPYDSGIDYPRAALDWIKQYELNRNDLLSHNVVWSESRKRLIFPVYGSEGLLAYSGRYFGDDQTEKKWWGKGDFESIFAFFGLKDEAKGRSLVLVEDVISAIKVSKVTQSLWLNGANLSIERCKRLFKLIPKGLPCILWLDPDMYPRMIKQNALAGSYGLNMRIMFSDKDPKEHTYSELRSLLGATS